MKTQNLVPVRLLTLAVFLAFSAPSVGGEKPNYPPLPQSTWETFVKRTSELVENPPHLTQARLPDGYKIGRCLLEVRGKRLIDGRCAYNISKGGDFDIQGPRQVYPRIDYPQPQVFASEISTDYFAQVDVNSGTGEAFKNGVKAGTHAHDYLGTVARKGACWMNATAKICAWKS